MVRFRIGTVSGKVGGDGIDLPAELFINGIDLLAEPFINGIDLLAEPFINGIDLLVQGVDLEINEIEPFICLAAQIADLVAKHFMPLKNQVELAADIFEQDFQIFLFHTPSIAIPGHQ